MTPENQQISQQSRLEPGPGEQEGQGPAPAGETEESARAVSRL